MTLGGFGFYYLSLFEIYSGDMCLVLILMRGGIFCLISRSRLPPAILDHIILNTICDHDFAHAFSKSGS